MTVWNRTKEIYRENIKYHNQICLLRSGHTSCQPSMKKYPLKRYNTSVRLTDAWTHTDTHVSDASTGDLGYSFLVFFFNTTAKKVMFSVLCFYLTVCLFVHFSAG